jgi:aspartate/tyrosine/aromatic aminotransferase
MSCCHACALQPSLLRPDHQKLEAHWFDCGLHVAAGLRDFNAESVKLAYGEDSPVLANKQVAAVQSLSGTGSCRLFAEFQKRFLPNSSIYIPVVSGGEV